MNRVHVPLRQAAQDAYRRLFGEVFGGKRSKFYVDIGITFNDIVLLTFCRKLYDLEVCDLHL